MTRDISAILKEWNYEPGTVAARIIEGEDGELRIQVRLDLGLLQMLMDGRPDGQVPFAFPSLLDYFEDVRADMDGDPLGMKRRFDDADDDESGDPGSSSGEGESSDDDDGDSPRDPISGDPSMADYAAPVGAAFSLNAHQCRALRDELSQFNQRAIALIALDEFDRAARDAARNIRVLDLCKQHAAQEDDRTVLEQYRPYLFLMRYRALASQLLKDSEPKAALIAIDDGLDAIKHALTEAGKPQSFDTNSEAEILRSMRDQLVPKLPLSQRAELKRRLTEALAAENYELAAILRDELKQLKD